MLLKECFSLLTHRTSTSQELINTTVIYAWIISLPLGMSREGDKDLLLLSSLSVWLYKGEMSKRSFCLALERQESWLVWPNQEVTCLSWQLKSLVLGYRIHITAQEERPQWDKARGCCCWKWSTWFCLRTQKTMSLSVGCTNQYQLHENEQGKINTCCVTCSNVLANFPAHN